MDKKVNVRQSNFELLRVFAMIMIVIHHIIVHAVYDQLDYAESINALGNAFFCYPAFYPQLWLVDLGTFFGPVADCIFVMVSGYFLVGKENHSVTGTSVKLLSQSLFAAAFVTVANCLYHVLGFSYNDLFLIEREDAVSPDRFEFFNESFWYIGFYYLVFIFGILFLNGFLKKLSQKKYLEFLVVLFAVIEFAFSRELINSISNYILIFVIGVFFYSLGGYIKMYDPFKKINTFVILFIMLLTIAAAFFSSYYCRMLDVERYIRSATESNYFQPIYIYNFHNILAVVNTVCLFELFKRIKVKNSRILNYLGAASFMAYLIHDNEFFYTLWYKYDWCTALYVNTWEFVCNLITVALLTFGIGVLIYSIYKPVFNGIKKLTVNEKGSEKS